MAGSYRHITDDEGRFRFGGPNDSTIENMSDAYEMAEEMYGMMWYLAQSYSDPAGAVENARRNYRAGILASPGVVEPE